MYSSKAIEHTNTQAHTYTTHTRRNMSAVDQGQKYVNNLKGG